MTAQDNQVSVDENTRKLDLNRRFEGFGWAALLITFGTLWLLPEHRVPPGSWLTAAGIILLGMNVVRHVNGVRMSGFNLVVGTVALIAGVSEFFGTRLPLFAIALIVIGVGILLTSMFGTGSMCAMGQGWHCCGPRRDRVSREQPGKRLGNDGQDPTCDPASAHR